MACSANPAASAARRPMRSESAPMRTRPATAAMPSALTSVAARRAGTPRSCANGTRWTRGTNTGTQVAAKTAQTIQKAPVRVASLTLKPRAPPSARLPPPRPPAPPPPAGGGDADRGAARLDEPAHDGGAAGDIGRGHAERRHDAVQDEGMPDRAHLAHPHEAESEEASAPRDHRTRPQPVGEPPGEGAAAAVDEGVEREGAGQAPPGPPPPLA